MQKKNNSPDRKISPDGQKYGEPTGYCMEDNRHVHVQESDVRPNQCESFTFRQILNIVVNIEWHIIGHDKQIGDGESSEYGVCG